MLKGVECFFVCLFVFRFYGQTLPRECNTFFTLISRHFLLAESKYLSIKTT